MIALAGLLVLVAVALLVGGLSNGDTALLLTSVGVSGLAGVVLVLQTLRRNRVAAGRTAEQADEAAATVRRTGSVAAGPAGGTGTDLAAAADVPVTTTAPTAPTAPPASTAGPSAGRVGVDPEQDGAPRAVAAGLPPPSDGPVPGGASGAAGAGAADAPDSHAAAPSSPSAEAAAPVGSHTARPVGADGPETDADGEPLEEEVAVTDLLMVLDLIDEVVVVDEHPRYHLAGCPQIAEQQEIPLPLSEAREDGFTACGVCCPDRHIAEAERARRAAAKR